MKSKDITLKDSAVYLLRSLNFLGSQKKYYIAGWMISGIELLPPLAIPFLTKEIIRIIEKQDNNSLTVVLAVFAGLLLITPFVVLGNYWKSRAVAYGCGELTKAVYNNIITFSVPKMAQKKQGDYISRLTNDCSQTVGVLNGYTFTSLLKFIIYTMVTLTILLISNWRICVLAVGISALSIVLASWLMPKGRKYQQRGREYSAEATSVLIETMNNAPAVRIFGIQSRLLDKFYAICKNSGRERTKFAAVGGAVEGAATFLRAIIAPLVFLISLWVLIRTQMPISQATFLSAMAGYLAEGMDAGYRFIRFVQPSLVASKRAYDILDTPGEVPGTNREVFNENEIAISFENIDFSYGEQLVLCGFSMHVKRGETVALVGSSGSGKSTVLKLAQKIYEPSSGSIYYFGENASDLSVQEIRQLVTYVPQAGQVFSYSVEENIGYGKIGASKEEIISAAKIADAHSFISEMPQGYNTPMGEAGNQVSGGQKQRISIARAILKNAPILLMDEATSALDVETELRMMDIIAKATKEKAVIIVAHRLQTMQNADRVLVMRQGKIVEEGTHQQLLENGGYYTKFISELVE